MVQKPWFKGNLGENFHRLQQVDNILPRIALTAKDPGNPEGFGWSCHGHIGREIGKHLQDGFFQDDDTIVLLGVRMSVMHTVIARGNDQVIVDSTLADGECRINIEKSTYYSDAYERTQSGWSEHIIFKAQISFGEFRENYLDKIVTGQNASSDNDGGSAPGP